MAGEKYPLRERLVMAVVDATIEGEVTPEESVASLIGAAAIVIALFPAQQHQPFIDAIAQLLPLQIAARVIELKSNCDGGSA